MTIGAVALLASLAGAIGRCFIDRVPQSRDFGCTEWRDCRELALAAADRGDYETFHDLAWRAVQTGPPKDPALMYLLARAQALSGRPHDALVMLQRLAEMGVRSDAATNDDFAARGSCPGGRSCRRASNALSHPASPPRSLPQPRPRGRPAHRSRRRPPPASSSPLAASAGGLRFSTKGFTLGGLAYDAVSRRFLFGDRLGRKLIVVGEGTNHAVDFVRADSAGFRDIAAIEIDDRRGDLWVVSAAPADGAATLHKLQLVSGRPLKSFPIAADPDPSRPSISPSRLPALSSPSTPRAINCWCCVRGTAVERVMRVDAAEPASLAAAEGRGHRVCGVSRRRIANRPASANRDAGRRSEIGLARSSRADPVAPSGADRDRVEADGTAHHPSRPQRQRTRGHEGNEDRRPGAPHWGQTCVDHLRGRACLSGRR